MEKKIISPVFIKSFEREGMAKVFAAAARGGKVTARYDYDFLRRRIIKTFEVKY